MGGGVRRGVRLAICAAAGLVVGLALVFGFDLRFEFIAIGLGVGVALGGVIEGQAKRDEGDPMTNGRRRGGRRGRS
jgi:hypothetical protein